MITYLTGDILDSKAYALINPVNLQGRMGKGLAKDFKARYPANYEAYVKACEKSYIGIGRLFYFEENELWGKRLIINFATKRHWGNKSEYNYIASGLNALKKAIIAKQIPSIAMPALGCGNGGLDWDRVKTFIEYWLADSPAQIEVYIPHNDRGPNGY